MAKRWLYSKLLSRADILTVLSPENLNLARKLFPHNRIELVLFGIKADIITPADRKTFHQPIRLVSVGNDIHRDWKTLVDAFRNIAGFEVRIASKTINKKLLQMLIISQSNIKTNQQLMDLYEWADVLIMALNPTYMLRESRLFRKPCFVASQSFVAIRVGFMHILAKTK